MLKKAIVVLFLVALVLGFAGVGVSQAQTLGSYPPMLLSVQHLPQVPPGDWGNTKNCGQTCALMAAGYLKCYCPAPSGITAENTWLAKKFNDTRYNNPNGYYTLFSGRNELGVLLQEYHGLKVAPATGGDITSVLYQLKMGRPTFISCRISGGQIVGSGGLQHWALAIGWDPTRRELIVNDPGSVYGSRRRLSLDLFNATWGSTGKVYAGVYR